MKAILPVAGIGTRLRPQTVNTPKAMVSVAGKPILGHILDDLLKSNIDDVIFIVGFYKEHIIEYVNEEYPNIKATFIYQKEMNGLGHAIWKAKEITANEDILIILGDTIYDVDLSKFIDSKNSVLGLRQVADPRRFGVAETTSDKKLVTKLVEKPDRPKSNLAIVGLYYIKNSKELMDALQYLIDNDIRTKNEFQLTDALQKNIEDGKKFEVFEINDWYDCGQADELLKTNQHILSNMKFDTSVMVENALIIEPCAIHPTAVIKNSIVGPNVSIGKNTEIKNSIVKNSIIASNCRLESKNIIDSIIGHDCDLKDQPRQLNLGAYTKINENK
jgi:glucose-1-phosphate thymidylyltransferase